MTENQKLREVFEQGWKMAAEWALSDHLLADMESPAYLKERDVRLQALAMPTAPPAGELPELPEPDRETGEGLDPAYSADLTQAYGEQCWKAGYKHGAWSDELMGEVDPDPYQPTHWMPLPPPPSAIRARGEVV